MKFKRWNNMFNNYSMLACKQALLFGRVKRVSRECASERRSSEGQRKGPSLARSREAHFACPNRRACSQANSMQSRWIVAEYIQQSIEHKTHLHLMEKRRFVFLEVFSCVKKKLTLGFCRLLKDRSLKKWETDTELTHYPLARRWILLSSPRWRTNQIA